MRLSIPRWVLPLTVLVLIMGVGSGCSESSATTTTTVTTSIETPPSTAPPSTTTVARSTTTDPPTTTEAVDPTTTTSVATTTTGLPTTTTLDITFTIATHGLHPESLPGSNDYFGSGCAPGSDDLPDGIWYGFAPEFDESTITFDLACLRWIPDPNDDDVEEGGWGIVNDNPKLRVVPVDPNAQVTCFWAGCPPGPFPYTEWIDEPHEVRPLEEEHGGLDMWLYINDGLVTEIGREGLPGGFAS